MVSSSSSSRPRGACHANVQSAIGAVVRFLGSHVLIALGLVGAYLIAAPSTVNPAAPDEAAALDTCTGSGKTLSVRADGGRYFVLPCSGLTNVSASCGTVTNVPVFGSPPIYKFESGSCLGPATFSWETEGTPHVQNMNIEANGNEPPECDPPDPGTTVAGSGISAGLSIFCSDSDFDASGLDEFRSSTTDPVHGSVGVDVPQNNYFGGTIYYGYLIDFEETLLARRCDDSFAITIGDDYSPNPKSLPPINVFVDNSAQRPPGNCPGPGGGEATGQRDAQIKKCKKNLKGKAKARKRKKCIKKARKLPV